MSSSRRDWVSVPLYDIHAYISHIAVMESKLFVTDQFRAKHAHMELFPEYVREAEERTHGDPHILDAPEYQPPQKVDYAGLFGARKTPGKYSPPSICFIYCHQKNLFYNIFFFIFFLRFAIQAKGEIID